MNKKEKKKDDLTFDLIFISLGLTVLLGLMLFVAIYYVVHKDEYPSAKTWNVYISRIVNFECSDTAVCTTPTVYTDSTTTGDYTVEFNEPGKAVYEVTVKNEGALDAELNSIILASPTCKGNAEDYGVAQIDALNVCQKLDYKLKDEDGNIITLGDIVKAGESKKYYLTLNYLDESYYVGIDERLSDSVTVNSLNLILSYGQL